MNGLTSKMYFKTLSIVHIALTLSLVLVSGIAYLTNQSATIPHDEQLTGFLMNLVPLAVLGFGTAAFIVYRNKIAEIKEMNNLPDKLSAYRSAQIVRYAMLEAPGMFATVAYFLTGKEGFLGLTLGLAIAFLLVRPSISKAISDMGLDLSESSLLQDPEATIIGDT